MTLPAVLFTPLEDLQISMFDERILLSLGLRRLGDLATAAPQEILAHPSGSHRRVRALNQVLAVFGDLQIGMTIPEWERDADTSGLTAEPWLQCRLGELNIGSTRYANANAVARMWLQLAAEQNNPEAQTMLAEQLGRST